MSITFAKSFVVNGKAFATLDAAQLDALKSILVDGYNEYVNGPHDTPPEMCECMAKLLLNAKDELIDILTITTHSRPKARKVNGGTKSRKPKATDAAVNAALQDQDA